MEGIPEVREAILSVAGQASSSRCVLSAEWRAMLIDRSVADPLGVVFTFRDGLYQIMSAEAKDFGPEGELVCFETTMLGTYDNHDWSPMARPKARDLDRYPELSNNSATDTNSGWLPAEIFADGFEAGTTTAWSTAIP
jgi:hypothetical protein